MGTRRHGETDRLSVLPDKTLERVLSHLASFEAARTVALSRRWRHVYQGVPVVYLVDTKKGDRYGCSVGEKRVCFDQQVTSAILCKASTTPIRTFRLNVFHPPCGLLDQWIMTALSSGVEELDVKLRYWDSSNTRLCPFDRSKDASADFSREHMNRYTKTPRQIFRSCSTLRRLRLKNWTLDLPRPGVDIASLESLHLVRIMDPDGLLQQLVSSCPRLAHLTLEECPSARQISVTSSRLHSFAMICCHHARRVVLHSRCLRSLRYKGDLPCESLFTVPNYEEVVALTIEICEDLSCKGSREISPVTALIRRCKYLTYLHLSLHPSMAYYSSLFTSALRYLPRLRQLGLQGRLHTDHAVRSVAVLLRDTRNLEVLSLFPEAPKKNRLPCAFDHESDSKLEEDDDYSVDHSRVTDSLWRMHIKCLDHKLRRINIVNYKGRQLENILADFLLSRAAALEEFSVTLTSGRSLDKHEIVKELRSWRSNRHTRVTRKTLSNACKH